MAAFKKRYCQPLLQLTYCITDRRRYAVQLLSRCAKAAVARNHGYLAVTFNYSGYPMVRELRSESVAADPPARVAGRTPSSWAALMAPLSRRGRSATER